jgi:uncharacterized protein YndB with AHSA1/START domain
MPSAERTVSIDRPVAEVFEFVADGRNGARWRSGVLDVSHQSGEGVGAVYRQGVRGPGGRRIAADYEITSYEPERLLAFRAIAGPVRPEGSYRFLADSARTVVTFSLHVELTGWKRLVMGRAVQSTMDAEMNALDKLKSTLEGAPSA